MTEHRIQARCSLRHGGSCRQWLFWWCVYLDVKFREDNTSPHNGHCADNFGAQHFILQEDKLSSGKSLSAQQLSYGKFRIGSDGRGGGDQMEIIHFNPRKGSKLVIHNTRPFTNDIIVGKKTSLTQQIVLRP